MAGLDDGTARQAMPPPEPRPLPSPEIDGLDPTTARRLGQAAQRRARGVGVTSALTALRPGDRRILQGWLSRLVGDDATASTLAIGMSHTDLLAWASDRHLGWALDALVRGTDHHDARWPELRVWELITIPASFDAWWFDRGVQDRALAWLQAVDATAQWLRHLEASRSSVWGAGPADGALRSWWRACWDRYGALRAMQGPPTWWPAGPVEVCAEPPAVVFSGPQGWSTPIDAEDLILPEAPHLALGGVVALLELICRVPTDPALARAVGRPSWRGDLAFVDQLLAVDPADAADDKDQIGWEILQRSDRIDLTAVRCRDTRSGGLQCRRAAAGELPAWMLRDRVDARVASLIHRWAQPPREVVLEALAALAGHPRVVRTVDRRRERIEVRSAELALDVRSTVNGVRIGWAAEGNRLDPRQLRQALSGQDAAGGRAVVCTDAGVWVLGCSEVQRRFALQLLHRPLVLPRDALRSLLERLPRIQQILPVHLDPTLTGPTIRGDPRPLFRIAFRDRSVVVEARIQPLPDAPSHPPGEGPRTLHVIRDDAPAIYVRERGDEPARVRALAQGLGLSDGMLQRAHTWAVDDLEAALDVVRALDPTAHRVEIDGPMPAVGDATADQLTLSVGSGPDWFALDGSLQTELGTVQLDQVAAAVEEGRSYLPVGHGYVRLEDALALRIKALEATKARDQIRLDAVHAPLIGAFEEIGATITGVVAWRDRMARMTQAQTMRAEIPAGLVATLRPYQIEGFRWLAGLASWAPGAVLADDMGLGKTIQTIALLLRRRDAGPALVVAPTSVAFNWRAELQRFAPSLRIVSYVGPDRRTGIVGLGPRDVVVTTYGLMWRDAEALSEIPWGTLVLDEAQAIKNPTSQRSRAAKRLNAGFCVALSGTPVENRPAELWSVFSVAVPGLLGSLEQFNLRFAAAGPRNRRALARVVSPFLLRRTKAAVAPDLPARIEVVDRLTLGADHQALYLRARQGAITRIADAAPAQKRFLLLGELTRLRQLSCDPRLVDAGTEVVGSKIPHLLARLQAVRGTGEQALVFSTFVKQLALVRPVLEAAGFRVAWLTGETPAGGRQAEVARFQRGEADVFLVSLKAGGTGLNLTAASYVFHLDPWWNPAAEDQATDRAHRIGQTRPVHVYRLVAAGTIEEQILALHEEKRAMVDDLLAGADGARGMDAEALMALLADPFTDSFTGPTPSGIAGEEDPEAP